MTISSFKGAAKICKYAVYAKTGEHIFEITNLTVKLLHFLFKSIAVMIKIYVVRGNVII